MFFDNLKVTHTAGHILEETHYYPFGLAMAGISTKALNNVAPNNYKFNAGNELNENFGINLYTTFYRLQDVQTGRFLNTDPLAEKYYSITTYNYAGNNPINSNDPLGDQMKDYGRMQKGPDGNYHSGWVSEMMWNEKGFFNYGEVYGFSGGDFGSSHTLYNIQGMSSQSFLNQKQLFGDNATWNVAKAQFGYWRYNIFDPRTRGYEEAPANSALLEEVAVGTGKEWVAYEAQGSGGCPNCLDPSSVGHNILGLSYPGGNNPLTRSGDYSYSYVPTNLSEYPAIGHDRRYDKLGIKGASGLFTDTRAIGADWRFVGEELSIAGSPFLNPIDRMSAGLLGVGLGLSALPKTLFQLSTPFGYMQTMMWYNISNQGVNNAPTIHKH